MGLILDDAGRVLLVDPVYKDGFILPGGSALANELPHVAVTREVHEEVGLELRPLRLLVVDCFPENRERDPREGISFVFFMGVVGPEAPILTDPEELRGVHWVAREDLSHRTHPYQCRRIRTALRVLEEGEGAQYLVQGEVVHVTGSATLTLT
ncbi:NUDIX domain-containing protein [Streptomyces sp. G45]|uniref:NUDIX domain-containing protein n=1 Tax=Streptomyces sp. G45 TaxID=3406627 RepID=UPI003C194C17